VSETTGAFEVYYQKNAHGDVVRLADTAGKEQRRYSYDAFGNERNQDSKDNNPFRYCGEYYDKETGSLYLRARYYNPATGRFLTEDTHWNPQNMIYGDSPVKLANKSYAPHMLSIMQGNNLYGYCVNSPIIFHDPNGKMTAEYVWEQTLRLAEKIAMLDGGALYCDAVSAAIIAGGLLITGGVALGEAIAAHEATKDKSIIPHNASDLVPINNLPQPQGGDNEKKHKYDTNSNKDNDGYSITSTSYDINQILSTQPLSFTNFAQSKAVSKVIHFGGYQAVKPIPVWVNNGNAYAIDGHHRLEAFRMLGYKRVPIKYVHTNQISNYSKLTPAQMVEYGYKSPGFSGGR